MAVAIVPFALGALLYVTDAFAFVAALRDLGLFIIVPVFTAFAVSALVIRTGHGRSAVVLALVALLIVSDGIVAVAFDTHALGWAAVRRAASRTIRDLDLPRDALVLMSSFPYPSGHMLTVRPAVGEPMTVSTDGETWFALIDRAPGKRFGHPVTYAFVTEGSIRTFDAAWLATIDDSPGWDAVALIQIAGHDVIALVSRLPAISSPSIDVAVSSLSHALGQMLSAGTAYAAEGKRRALIIDGADELIRVPSGLPTPWLWLWLDRISIGMQMAHEADELSRLLPDHGYQVRRLSGLAANAAPAPDADRIEAEISAMDLRQGDELFLHISAHGSEDGVVLYDKSFHPRFLSYDRLAAILTKIPSGVRTVVSIDACHSGAAIDKLARIEGVDVSAATSANGIAPGGVGDEQSYTESIIAGLRSPLSSISPSPLDDALLGATADFKWNGAVTTPKRVTAPAPVAAGEDAAAGTSPTPTATPTPTYSATPTPTPTSASVPAVAPDLVFSPVSLGPMIPGQTYQLSLCQPPPSSATSLCGTFPATTNPRGGNPPYSFTTQGGFPPPGMSLNLNGTISGVPAAAAGGRTYIFTVCAKDLSGNASCQAISIAVATIATPTPTPEPIIAPSGTVASVNCVQTGSFSQRPVIKLYSVTVTGSATAPVGGGVRIVLNRFMTQAGATYVASAGPMPCSSWGPRFGDGCTRAGGQSATTTWTATFTNVYGGYDNEVFFLDQHDLPGPKAFWQCPP